MKIKLLVFALCLTNTALAIGPTIECRFAAITDEGRVELDEIAEYILDPKLGLDGDFDPYAFDISADAGFLYIAIYLDKELINGIKIPIRNIIDFPLGTSIFGSNTIVHEEVDGFVSLQYECIRGPW